MAKEETRSRAHLATIKLAHEVYNTEPVIGGFGKMVAVDINYAIVREWHSRANPKGAWVSAWVWIPEIPNG